MNAANLYTGDVRIRRRDGSYWTFNFDYAARAALKSAFGTTEGRAATDIEVATKLGDLVEGDLAVLVQVTVIALQRHHQGVDADQVMFESLPQGPCMQALLLAMRLAVNGGDGPAQQPDERPPEGAASAAPAPRQTNRKTRSRRR